MLMSQTSLPQRLVQWLDTNFIAIDGPGARRELSELELVRTLEGYEVLIRAQRPSDVRQLQTPVAEWTEAMRTQVTELLRRVDQQPLTSINRLLNEFIETCKQQPSAEDLQREGDEVSRLIEAEQVRIQCIRKGTDDGPGTKREQLRDLLDGAEKWKAKITKLAQRVKSRVVEIHAWQIITSIARDLDRQSKNVLAPALSTRPLIQFSQQLTEVCALIASGIEPDAEMAGSLDCRTMPAMVAEIVKRRTVKIAEHSETFRRLPARHHRLAGCQRFLNQLRAVTSRIRIVPRLSCTRPLRSQSRK